MATGPTIATYSHREFLFRLQTLVIDGGTDVLRSIFDQRLQNQPLNAVLANEQPTLNRLRRQKTITQAQYDLLYPSSGPPPTSKDFDITLIVCLLRNLPSLGLNQNFNWNVQPQTVDTSIEADIYRLRMFRNQIAHISSTSGFQQSSFQSKWSEIETVLLRLDQHSPTPNFSQTIDSYKYSPMDPANEQRIRTMTTQWQERDRGLETDMQLIKKDVSDTKVEVTSMKKDVSDTKDEITGMKKDVSDTKDEVTSIKKDVSDTKDEVTSIKKDVSDTRDEVTSMKKDVSDTKDEVTSIKKDVGDTKADVSDTKYDVTKIKKDVGDTKGDITNIKKEVSDTKGDVSDMKDDFTSIKKEFSDTKDDVKSIKKEVRGTKEDVSGMKKDVGDTKDDLKIVKDNVKEIKQDVSDLKKGMLSDEDKEKAAHDKMKAKFIQWMQHELFVKKSCWRQPSTLINRLK